MKITLNRPGIQFHLYGDEANYQMISVSGLDPVQAQISTTRVVGEDGSRFNSAKLADRNIVILLAVNGDAEENRLRLYSMFPSKSEVRVFVKTELRNVYIDGYVEKISCNAFEKGIRAQISIICPSPWFMDTHKNVADASGDENVTFSVENTGDAPSDFELYLSIATGQFTGLDVEAGGSEMSFSFQFASPDTVYIDTESKYADDGQVNLIQYMSADSEFPQLPVGESSVIVTPSDQAQITGVLEWRNRYGGV